MLPTANFGWQHPESGDHTRTWEYWNTFVDVDRDLKTVKTTADTAKSTADGHTTALGRLPTRVQASYVQNMSFTAAANSGTKTVTFPIAFANSPIMSVNIRSAPGASAGWISRALTASTTSFLLYLAGTSTGVGWTTDVDWIAMERTTAPAP